MPPGLTDLENSKYLVVTLHRATMWIGNNGTVVAGAGSCLNLRRYFPVHPARRYFHKSMVCSTFAARMRCIEPLGYVEFLKLAFGAAAVLTDSGGLQEGQLIWEFRASLCAPNDR